MSTAPSISSQNNLVFICENDEQIAIPENFPNFSRFLREYLNTFMVENADEKSRQAASSIQLSQIEKKHVKVIFDFVEQWKRKMPSEYNDMLLDEDHVKKITAIPTWSQAFFQIIDKDDLISSANAANFLAVSIFVKYFTNFLVNRLESCDTSSEMADLMNLENDFSRKQKEAHKKFLENGSFKELVIDYSPEEKPEDPTNSEPSNQIQPKTNGQSNSQEFSTGCFGSNV